MSWMTTEEAEAIKAEIIGYLETWKDLLGLAMWEIKPEFHLGEVPKRNKQGKASPDALSDAAAACWSDYRYLHARLDFSVTDLNSMSSEERLRVTRHELMHIVMSELTQTARTYCEDGFAGLFSDLDEAYCSRIELIVDWAYKEGHKDGRKEVSSSDALEV